MFKILSIVISSMLLVVGFVPAAYANEETPAIILEDAEAREETELTVPKLETLELHKEQLDETNYKIYVTGNIKYAPTQNPVIIYDHSNFEPIITCFNFSRTNMPNIVANMEDAFAKGKSNIVTYNGPNHSQTRINRQINKKGWDKTLGSMEEFPPASSQEGE